MNRHRCGVIVHKTSRLVIVYFGGGEGVRFRVMRTTSRWNDRVQPCAEAVQEAYMGRDCRGPIVRDLGPKTAWFIELDTLADLLAFRDR
jgi:hypothetical protein